jgi:hypothetical protein
MKPRFFLLAALAFAATALLAPTGNAGGQLPPVELEGFAQTKAKSFDDFAGRAVLIEFFAYW